MLANLVLLKNDLMNIFSKLLVLIIELIFRPLDWALKFIWSIGEWLPRSLINVITMGVILLIIYKVFPFPWLLIGIIGFWCSFLGADELTDERNSKFELLFYSLLNLIGAACCIAMVWVGVFLLIDKGWDSFGFGLLNNSENINYGKLYKGKGGGYVFLLLVMFLPFALIFGFGFIFKVCFPFYKFSLSSLQSFLKGKGN